ncbi:MAG: PstS family phosphate ABC transporter substrate-binding protein [Mariniblastus sp.]|nr:PstS family phosphate ABC transporter substrate-binding protein [Mariniblastus sp.]
MKTILSVSILATVTCFFTTSSIGQDTRGWKDLEGKINVDGSSTVAPITIQADASFRKLAPKVKIPVGVSGTGGGFKRFTKGETDISDASRPIKFAEFESCKKNGVSFIEIPVAYDGLTIAVSKNNDFVDTLTVDQLKKIFLADKKDKSFLNAKSWKEINDQWPASPIKIFAPGTDSGTFDYFKEVIVGKSGSSMRDDMSVSEDDNVLVQGIAKTDGAIGFFGASYYFSNTDKLKAVKIVNPDGEAVEVSAANIESGKYAPFSRPLFIYVNSKSARRPEVRAFVSHYLDNAAGLAAKVQYVGLPDQITAAAKKHFKTRKTGTHFWSVTGGKATKKEGSLTELYTVDQLVK